ncbi:hypothetical protein B0H34DRAFT_669093, partial [Crassisporium funariophilum]
LLANKIPTMFNLPDIVHFISNTIKDIVKLTYFNSSTTILRGVITKFYKLHLGEAKLNIVHVICGTGKGLDSTGETCFGTVIIAAWAYQLNIPSIRKLVKHGQFNIGEFGSCFEEASQPSFEFEFDLSQLIKLGLPALKALTCLEANKATVGDVYIFWHAMMWSIKKTLDNPKSGIPTTSSWNS